MERVVKETYLANILNNETDAETKVKIWNAYCEENGLDGSVIYKNLPSVINDLFPDAASFAKHFIDLFPDAASFAKHFIDLFPDAASFAKHFIDASDYDYCSDWLVFSKENVTSFNDITCDASPLDTDKVVDWLLGGGECDGKKSLQQGMKEWFVFAYFVVNEEDYIPLKDTEAYKVLDGYEIDYITADWDELAAKVKELIDK